MSESKPRRYAAYDLDLLRFFGPVHDEKNKAKAYAGKSDVTNYEIREV